MNILDDELHDQANRATDSTAAMAGIQLRIKQSRHRRQTTMVAGTAMAVTAVVTASALGINRASNDSSAPSVPPAAQTTAHPSTPASALAGGKSTGTSAPSASSDPRPSSAASSLVPTASDTAGTLVATRAAPLFNSPFSLGLVPEGFTFAEASTLTSTEYLNSSWNDGTSAGTRITVRMGKAPATYDESVNGVPARITRAATTTLAIKKTADSAMVITIPAKLSISDNALLRVGGSLTVRTLHFAPAQLATAAAAPKDAPYSLGLAPAGWHFFSTDGSSDLYGGPLSGHDSRFADKLIVSLVQEIPGSAPAHYNLTCAGKPALIIHNAQNHALRIKWHGDVYAEIQLPMGLNATDQQLMQMGAKLQIRDDSQVAVG